MEHPMVGRRVRRTRRRQWRRSGHATTRAAGADVCVEVNKRGQVDQNRSHVDWSRNMHHEFKPRNSLVLLAISAVSPVARGPVARGAGGRPRGRGPREEGCRALGGEREGRTGR